VSLRRAQGLPDDVKDPALLALLRRLVRGAARIMTPPAEEQRDEREPSSMQGSPTHQRLSRRS
jgi:hypothetical protein